MFTNKKLLKILLILSNIILFIYIFKLFKILDICYTFIVLIAPIFWGYALAWLIKPVMLYISNYLDTKLSTTITYAILLLLIVLIGYLSVPVIINEIKVLIPEINNIYIKIEPYMLEKVDLTQIINMLNKYSGNIKDIVLSIFYTLFISFFFLVNHKSVSNFFSKIVPTDLIYDISINLKAFVKGTLLVTVILFALSFISFSIAGLPYSFLFAIIISLTNIIPYIGPYIGGVPSVLVAFNVSSKLGITILIVVILLQALESAFIHPYVMSKSVKINPIFIIIGLIIFGYFFGVIGLLLSIPILCIIKTLYLYNKEHNIISLQVLGKLFY